MLIDLTENELQYIQAAMEHKSSAPGNFYLPEPNDPEVTVDHKIYQALQSLKKSQAPKPKRKP